MFSRIWFVILLILQIGFSENDTESWNSVGVELKLPRSFALDLEQELRLQNNFSTFKKTITDMSLSYNLFDGFKLFIPLRYSLSQDKIKKRISFGGSYKQNFKLINFKYRSKLQREYEQGKLVERIIRNKVTVDKRFNKKLKPFIAVEIFHSLKNDQYENDEYRISVGTSFNLSKKNKLKIFYTYKCEGLTKLNRDIVNIIGFRHTISF